MTTQRDRRNWGLAVRVLAVSVGVTAAAQLAMAPAHADTTNDAFLSALSNAGIGYNDPGSAVSLGQSICPMLAQPGGSFAGVASSMSGNNSISPGMAALFTSIAISMYCPSMMASFANGDFLQNGSMPGMPFQIPGLSGLPGQ
jgi:hypothetical protein